MNIHSVNNSKIDKMYFVGNKIADKMANNSLKAYYFTFPVTF